MLTNALPMPPLPLQQQVVDNRVLLTVPWAMLLRWVLAEASAPSYVEGPHSDRVPPPPLADPGDFRPGTWWYETDRGVFYQARSVITPPETEPKPTWVYALGTMWGTFSPDERPTDLGFPDTGFEFRTTDLPARHFIWSGSSWVEVSQGADALAAKASGPVLLTTSWQTIPGATLTLDRAGWWWIHAVFDFQLQGAGDLGSLFYGGINISSALLPSYAQYSAANAAGATTARSTVAQQWLYQNPVPGAPVLLAAVKTAGSGTSACQTETTLVALWVKP